MNKDFLQSRIDLINKNKKVEHVSLHIDCEDRNLTRFAENRIIQNVSKETNDIRIKAFHEQSTGLARTQDTSDESILRNLKRAEEIAMSSPEDPEFVEPLEKSEVMEVDRFTEETGELSTMEKAETVKKIRDRALKKGMEIAGRYVNGEYFEGFANTRGHIASHHATQAEFTITAMFEDSSGYGSDASEDIGVIDPEKIASRAFRKAELTRNPEELEPGEYPVILEPQAVADLIPYFSWTMNRRAADEGYVYFAGKMGEEIFDPSINMYSDPEHPDNPSQPFQSSNGLPLKRVKWVEEGVLKNLITERFWARKKGIEPVGFPTNVIIDGGSKNLEQLIKSCDEGLLITRLWYIRFVNRQDMVLTGMTRDGLLKIEDGEIAGAVKNMRFNDSPVRLLKNVIELGKEERVGCSYLVPPVYSSGFKLASKTLF